jgi:hypothetical protein
MRIVYSIYHRTARQLDWCIMSSFQNHGSSIVARLAMRAISSYRKQPTK